MNFTLPDPEFQFAGFTFPKWVFTLPKGPFRKRIAHMRQPTTGPYYHTPTPNQKDGIGFYLASDGMPGLRWAWCDEIDKSIRHAGWWADDDQDTKIHGFVMRLPRGRGFLAGWSMGEHMASSLDYAIYPTALEAARAADSMAERAAENEREYQAKQRQEEAEL